MALRAAPVLTANGSLTGRSRIRRTAVDADRETIQEATINKINLEPISKVYDVNISSRLTKTNTWSSFRQHKQYDRKSIVDAIQRVGVVLNPIPPRTIDNTL